MMNGGGVGGNRRTKPVSYFVSVSWGVSSLLLPVYFFFLLSPVSLEFFIFFLASYFLLFLSHFSFFIIFFM
jgi:hypothetical protein